MLPKISYPTYTVDLPSTKAKVTCRPMLTKEEKILLVAKQSDDEADKLGAIRQVVNNCLIDEMDVDKLAIFDLEWLFLKIRSQSVSNKTKVNYRDHGDDKVYEFEIDLDKIVIWYPPKPEDVDDPTLIKVDERVTLKMKYPPASLYTDLAIIGRGDEDALTLLIARCIDKVFNGENTIPTNQVPEAEMLEFLNNLHVLTYDKIRAFVASVPHLLYTIEYENSKKEKRSIRLTSLDDLFSF